MPEFYVLYNGTDRMPDKMTLRLSDAFMLKKERNEVLEKCQYMREYSQFVQTVRDYIEFGADLEGAIKKAIEY